MFAIFLSEKMDPFYQNIASFPTMIFTFFLVIVTLYWLVAMLGFIDIDVLDFDIPDADDSLDINADNTMSTPDALAGLMLKFGLYGVPVTIIISLISLFAWLICYYAVHFSNPFIPGRFLELIVGLPIFLLSLYVGVMITAQLIKPLRPLFRQTQQETIKHVLGQTATVRTSRVDSTYGEASLADGGAGLILKVRATGDAIFKRKDKVVLLEYNDADNTYRVVSEEEFSTLKT